MASSLGQLIVSINADLTGLRKQIKEAERTMQSSAKTLGGLSTNLTQAISLPLAAVGIGAIKSAADMEKLQSALSTTMEAGGRSAAESRTELEALRQAALAPGLDFEQAVKGSVRLQNVGFSAEKSREILVQLANAVAITGGSASELDGVTRQFGQMIAKGRILQEDLSIIQENMPAISEAMEKAFGTKSAEKLRDLGISAEDFIGGVIGQLGQLPRVTGGLSNSIVNAFSAIRQSAAQVGEIINKNFGVSDRLNDFAAWLGSLTQAFSELDPTMQKTVLGVAAFAFALGPAIKAGSLLVNGMLGIGVAAKKAAEYFYAVTTAGNTMQGSGLITWFRSLNAVMQANIIGLAIGVVLAAAAAYSLLSEKVSASTIAAQTVKEVQASAAKSVAEQTVRTNALVAIMESENSTYQQKQYALEELQKISPEYFGTLKLGAYQTGEATKANQQYAASLIKIAEAQAAQQKLASLAQQGLDVEAALKKERERAKSLSGPASNPAIGILSLAVSPLGAIQAARSQKAKSEVSGLEEELAAINKQKEALAELIISNEQANASKQAAANSTKKNTIATEATTKSVSDASQKAKAYKEALEDVRKEVDKAALAGKDVFDAQANSIENGLEKLIDAGFSKNSEEVARFIGLLKDLKETVKTIDPVEPLAGRTIAAPVSLSAGIAKESPIEPVPTEVLDSYARLPKYLQDWRDKVEETGKFFDAFWTENGAAMSAASEAMIAFGGAIESSLSDSKTSWADFASAAKQAIVDVIGNLIRLAVANAVTKAFASSPNPLLGAALAALAGSLAAGVFRRIVSSVKFKFAAGTLHAPAGKALVGENGPELLNIPRVSGIRLPAKQATAVKEAIHRASSASIFGGMQLVGANGPEVINLPDGAQVIPAHETRSVLQSFSKSESLQSASNRVTAIYDRLKDTKKDTLRLPGSVTSTTERILKTISHPALPRFASGTRYAPGGLSIVGEFGPEIINLSRGDQVVPAPQTNKILDNLSLAQEVQVGGTFRVSGTDLLLVLEKAQHAERRVRGK